MQWMSFQINSLSSILCTYLPSLCFPQGDNKSNLKYSTRNKCRRMSLHALFTLVWSTEIDCYTLLVLRRRRHVISLYELTFPLHQIKESFLFLGNFLLLRNQRGILFLIEHSTAWFKREVTAIISETTHGGNILRITMCFPITYSFYIFSKKYI